MTGPEHYREAERLVEQAGNDPDPAMAQAIATGALAHATLAQAAATAATVPPTTENAGINRQWYEAGAWA